MSETKLLTKPMFKLPEGAPTDLPPRKSPEEKKYYLLIVFKMMTEIQLGSTVSAEPKHMTKPKDMF